MPRICLPLPAWFPSPACLLLFNADLHGAAFSHPTNRPSLSSSREALQKEEAKPSTMPSARRRCKMKNQKALLSPALHTTTFCALSSTITQDLVFILFPLTTLWEIPPPSFPLPPPPHHPNQYRHRPIIIVNWINNDHLDAIPQI